MDFNGLAGYREAFAVNYKQAEREGNGNKSNMKTLHGARVHRMAMSMACKMMSEGDMAETPHSIDQCRNENVQNQHATNTNVKQLGLICLTVLRGAAPPN